ncbi:hypothetical protein BH10ACI3_BH10ACI3_19460 [soil metagenome]
MSIRRAQIEAMERMEILMRLGEINVFNDIVDIAAGVGDRGIKGGRGAPGEMAGQGVEPTKQSVENAKKITLPLTGNYSTTRGVLLYQ